MASFLKNIGGNRFKNKNKLMKLSNLKWRAIAVFVILTAVIIITSCNNSDKSANNSTTTEVDTSVANTSTANTTSTAPKKSGKVMITANTTNMKEKMTMDNKGYYNYTEVAPFYKGGQSAIEDYINNSIDYPQEAIDNNIEGTVIVLFNVEENGNITDVKTVGNKIGYGLEEEAVKAVSSMSKWTPGVVKGKNVKSRMTIPITFKIEA